MEQQITISVEELKELINKEVQNAMENAKPVRDKQMKELESYFRNEITKNEIDINWYHAWMSVRSSVALKMGFKTISKVSHEKYDEFIENIKREMDEIIEIFKKEEGLKL